MASGILEKLRAAGEPRPDLYTPKQYGCGELAAALEGRFRVFAKIDSVIDLTPPVDWRQDPFNNPSWRAQLHTLRFLDVLLASPDRCRRVAMEQAQRIALDWVLQNRRQDSRAQGTFAWSDKIAGDRAPYLAHVLRSAGACEVIAEEEAKRLFESAVDHGDFLSDSANYVPGTNHGLAMDAGLVLLACYLPFEARASTWRETGVDRFVASLKSHVSDISGVHLEHSLEYHVMVTSLARKLRRRAAIQNAELDRVIDKMLQAGAWFTSPDGCVPAVGDSDELIAPKWLRASAGTAEGLKLFFDAGYGVVRVGGSYLLVSAGHHSSVHKQADDSSFVLYEGGKPLVTDAGKYAYVPKDPARRYALSCFAHNVLVVDGLDFPWKSAKPYGSGLLAGGTADGWYAMRVTNPLVEQTGVCHQRTFVYRPQEFLVLVDEVQAETAHEYSRLVHFAPHVSLVEQSRGFRAVSGDVRGYIRDWSGQASRHRVARGEHEPQLQGWIFRGYREWIPVPTATFDTAGTTQMMVLTMSFRARELRTCSVQREGSKLIMRLKYGAAGHELVLRDQGEEIAILPR